MTWAGTSPIIIIIIIIIFVINFMEGIYDYMPEINHVSRAHTVAAAVYLPRVLHVMFIIIIRYGCLLSQAFSSWYFS